LSLPCEGARLHTVRPGDTFYGLALEIGVSVDDIIRLNPDVDPDNLQVGTLICVPLEPGIPTGRIPPCDSGLYWVIAAGDTIFSISQVTGIPVETLLALTLGSIHWPSKSATAYAYPQPVASFFCPPTCGMSYMCYI
jgi:hypothetical protein